MNTHEKVYIYGDAEKDEIYDLECELMKQFEFFTITANEKTTHYQVHNFQTDSDYVFQSETLTEMSDNYQNSYQQTLFES